jgi:VCBS repeat-containing protein
MRRAVAVAAGIALVGGFAATTPASAETSHFSQLYSWNTPLGTSGPGCPSYLGGDYALIVGTGNGVDHASTDSAGGFHATSTFTGDVTITLYSPQNVVITGSDEEGNLQGTPTGPADGVWTGRLTQSFEVSQTKQGQVFGDTASFRGTDGSGQAISLHINQHQTWTPGTVPYQDPPTSQHNTVSC